MPQKYEWMIRAKLADRPVYFDVGNSAPFDNRDGSWLRIDTDYFGKRRNERNPFPGPFELPGGGRYILKVWGG